MSAVGGRLPVQVERIDVGRIQERVPLVRHVVPGRAAHREEAPRPKSEVQAARKALDALPRLDRLGLRRREEPISLVDRAVGATEQPAGEDPVAVVVVLRQRQIARDVCGGDRQIHQAADLVAQIGAETGLPEFENALLSLEVARYVERGDLITAGGAQAIMLPHALAERGALLERVEAVDHDL